MTRTSIPNWIADVTRKRQQNLMDAKMRISGLLIMRLLLSLLMTSRTIILHSKACTAPA